jgi:hypothetical protein
VDSADQVGEYSSMIIGFDGNPIISYFDNTNDNLKVAKCNDVSCSTATITTADSTTNTGQYTSIALRDNGNPVVSYWDLTNDAATLKICGQPECTSGSKFPMWSPGGPHTSISIDEAGTPYAVFTDNGGTLRWGACLSSGCNGDTGGQIGHSNVGATSLTFGPDGLANIAYYDNNSDVLKFIKCFDHSCSTKSTQTIDSSADVGRDVSMVLGADGLPIMSYRDFTNGNLKVAKCSNPLCAPYWTIP